MIQTGSYETPAHMTCATKDLATMSEFILTRVENHFDLHSWHSAGFVGYFQFQVPYSSGGGERAITRRSLTIHTSCLEGFAGPGGSTLAGSCNFLMLSGDIASPLSLSAPSWASMASYTRAHPPVIGCASEYVRRRGLR